MTPHPMTQASEAAFAKISAALDERNSLLAQVEELKAALRAIETITDVDRITVNENNAFEEFSKLNKILVDVRHSARMALKGERP